MGPESVMSRDHMFTNGDYHTENPEVFPLAIKMSGLDKTSAEGMFKLMVWITKVNKLFE